MTFSGRARRSSLNRLFFQKHYKAFLKSQYLAPERIREIQTAKLKHILKTAVTTVPYYLPLKKEVNFDNFSLDELQKFPVVNKEMISAEPELFCSGKNKKQGFVSHTSGSTGKAFEFLNPFYSNAWEDMAKFRAWGMGQGYRFSPKDPVVVLRSYSPKGEEPLHKVDKKNNYWYLSAFDINEKNLDLYLEVIRKSNARLLRGYASSVYILTCLLKEKGIRLDQIKVLATSSETLLPSWRETIESYWGFKVCDWYGLNERTVTVQRCWAGHYHNNDEYGILELDGQNQIISTSLHNDVMPFIRYATRDVAIPLARPVERCPCGRTLSIPFQGIEGRSDDILIKQDGTQIPTVNIYTLMQAFDYIQQFRIIQKEDLALEVELVAERPISQGELEDIREAVEQRTGVLPMRFRPVGSIARDPRTGKVQAVKSMVKRKTVLELPYVHKTKPYRPVSQQAWELAQSGCGDVLKLDWNEATIPPSPSVLEAVNQMTSGGYLNWYPSLENRQLLEAIADYAGVERDNVQTFCSSDALHECILRTYVAVGDKILVVAPTYDNFRGTAEVLGAEVSYFHLGREGWEYSLDHCALRQRVEKLRPKLVYLCSPNNPTGTSYSRDEIEALLDSQEKVLFLVDEAYYEFCGLSVAPLVNKYKNLIISRTLSKAFALASFRVGYGISAAENILSLSKVRNAKSIPALSQAAALAALEDRAYMEAYVGQVRQSQERFVAALNRLKVDGLEVCSGAGNFCLLTLASQAQARALKTYLEERHIFVRDFSSIASLESCLRVTLGLPDQMDRVAREVEGFFTYG